jgi:S-formylglutathione hydrolase
VGGILFLAVSAIEGGARFPGPAPLVDQGLADKFLLEQLRPERLEQAAAQAGQPLTLRRHAGFDHGYFFVQSFVEDHLRFHARALGI